MTKQTKKSINLKLFEACEAGLDSLYSNEKYDEKFIIEDKYGEFHSVSLIWRQGWGQNYFFCVGDECSNNPKLINPIDVEYIEDK